MKNREIIKSILKYMPIYILALVFLLLLQYSNSLTALFIGEILGIFEGSEDILPSFLVKFINGSSIKSKIISVSIIYVIVSLVATVANFFSRYFRMLYSQFLTIDLGKKYYKHVLDLPKSEYSKRSTGDIIQRNTEDCKRIGDLFNRSLFEIFRIVFTIITLLMQIYILNKSIFTTSVVALILCLSFAWYYGYFKYKPRELQSSKYYSELNSTIQQSVTNYSLVKSFANEEYEFNKFKNINDKKEQNNYHVNNLHCIYWLLSDTLTTIYLMTCFILLGVSYFNGVLSLAVVSALVSLSLKVLSNAPRLVNYVTSFVRTFIASSRVNEYLSLNTEYKDDGTISKDVIGNIEFKNVYMKYDNEDVLKDLTFSIKEGETLAIVGKSGSGKTSIINLLTKLDDYYKGSIQIDGVELKDYKKKCIRDNIGVVLQDAYIFSKTIKENLMILLDDDRIDLDMYLKRVSLDEDINKFESGLETIVGERGVTLSGGQRQRMSLLRTIIKNKKILILDDTLSAVDNIVSRQIKNSLKKEKATTIIISHNLLNVKDADKIIVLDEGRITDIGTHEELINKEGFYSSVWNLQQKIEEVQ